MRLLSDKVKKWYHILHADRIADRCPLLKLFTITKENIHMAHMCIEEKKRVEFLLGCGNTLAEIARALGRSESTILRELRNRRIDSNKHYGCSNRLCARFDECRRFGYNGHKNIPMKNILGCFEFCSDFIEASCSRLNHAPYVCNGCESAHNCPLRKFYYIPTAAHTRYVGILSNARRGVHPSLEKVQEMSAVLSPAIRKGQSVDAVMANHPELFGDYARSTVYGWIEDGLFAAKKFDLPFVGTRRKPHKKPIIKTCARCREGRTYNDLQEWLKLNPNVVPTEADTVIGNVAGKVLFTFWIDERLPLIFIRDSRTSQTFTRIINMLMKAAGLSLYKKLFQCLLLDNAPEFSDPEAVEHYRPDPEHNPSKLMPRGTKVFYCDPYCPTQKGNVERFNGMLRRILPKGVSFDSLDQDVLDLVMSHLISYPSPVLGGKTPYASFVERFGEEGKRFLTQLNIVRITADEVTLHPILLGRHFQKLADRAILKKNGVI